MQMGKGCSPRAATNEPTELWASPGSGTHIMTLAHGPHTQFFEIGMEVSFE